MATTHWLDYFSWAPDNFIINCLLNSLNGKGKIWDSSTYKWFYHCRGSGTSAGSMSLGSVWGRRGYSSLPSSAMTVSVTVTPASLISWTMLSCDNSTMHCPFTAEMWSPTFSFPQRSAGLPSMTRPILWGITMKEKSSQVFQLFNISLSIGFIISNISIKNST